MSRSSDAARRPLALGLAALLAAAVAVAVAGPVRTSDAATTATPTPRLTWTPCGAGLECGVAPVPLDHDAPEVGTVRLPLVRVPARDPALREGTVFVDAGAQAGGGTGLVRGLGVTGWSGVTERFDVVGVDSRGTGGSEPGFRCLTYEQVRAAEAPIPAVMTTADRPVKLAESRALVDGCTSRSAAMMAHMSSGDAARDLDLLRAAVGDEKLTYLGVSYGGLPGQQYALQHPERVRALVLDSAPSARLMAADPLGFDRDQMEASERSLRAFASWCDGAGAACGFGRGNAAAAFESLVARLEVNRVRSPADHSLLTGGDLVVATVGATIDPGGWPRLGALLAATDATPVPTDPVTPTGDDTVTGGVLAAGCLDRAFPRDPAAHDAHLDAAVGRAPRLAGVYGYGGLKCALWPVDPLPPVSSWRPASPVPAMVVGGSGDPLVPESSSEALTADLDARRVFVDGPGHTTIGRGLSCVDGAVTGFLLRTGATGSDPVTCGRPAPGRAG